MGFEHRSHAKIFFCLVLPALLETSYAPEIVDSRILQSQTESLQ